MKALKLVSIFVGLVLLTIFIVATALALTMSPKEEAAAVGKINAQRQLTYMKSSIGSSRFAWYKVTGSKDGTLLCATVDHVDSTGNVVPANVLIKNGVISYDYDSWEANCNRGILKDWTYVAKNL